MTTTENHFTGTRIDISSDAIAESMAATLAAARKIKAGATFRILLGTPRLGTITKVTASKVYYTTVNEAGELVPRLTSRSMFDNAAAIEVL